MRNLNNLMAQPSANYLKKIAALNQEQQKWLVIIFACLLCVCAAVSLIYPTIVNFSAVKRQFAAQNKNLIVGTDKLRTLTGLKKEFEHIQSVGQVRLARFFSDTEASIFLKQLNKTTADIGGRILAIKPVSEQFADASLIGQDKDMVYVKSLVQLDYQGDFASLLSLLQMFRGYEKLIGVETLRIAPDRNASSELSVNMVLALYKRVPGKLEE